MSGLLVKPSKRDWNYLGRGIACAGFLLALVVSVTYRPPPTEIVVELAGAVEGELQDLAVEAWLGRYQQYRVDQGAAFVVAVLGSLLTLLTWEKRKNGSA